MADEQVPSEKQLLLKRTYIKDFSFESPKAPQVFTLNVNPKTLLNIRSTNREIDAEHVEVTLTLTVKSMVQEDTIFLIELMQAGVFSIKGYAPEERFTLLGSVCPGMLYPFGREAIADVAIKGGFPQLLLQPLNFDALLAQNMQERAAQTQNSML